MNSIAINICLLPSLEIKEICTRVYKQDQSDYLDEELPYIPHITLLQKVVSEEDLEKLTEDVKKLQIDKFDLETNNFFFSFLLGLKIKRTEQITALQKKIIDIASKYKSVVATKEAFITGANFCEDSIDRVENYLQYLNFENDLHITL